ncbi:hypothetical protein GBA52_029017 [Prunus armeniaca]|nr:hypothetical protein GBA52_029017 [Prunus armeniaca]
MFWEMAWVSQTLGIWKFSMSITQTSPPYPSTLPPSPSPPCCFRSHPHTLALSKYSRSDGHCSLMIEDGDY